MVKIELMGIQSGTLCSKEAEQSLFRRMSSRSLIPRASLSKLPTPSPTLRPNLTTNSVVSSSFTALKTQGTKLTGRRSAMLSRGCTSNSGPVVKKGAIGDDLMCRLSLPCPHGCCYCVYGRLLGPVRVYMSNFTPQKDERKIKGIKDGNGKNVFPVSRKRDLKGLVYDHDTFSLHPPLLNRRQHTVRAFRTSGYRHITGSSNTSPRYPRIWTSRTRLPQRLS